MADAAPIPLAEELPSQPNDAIDFSVRMSQGHIDQKHASSERQPLVNGAESP